MLSSNLKWTIFFLFVDDLKRFNKGSIGREAGANDVMALWKKALREPKLLTKFPNIISY
jgi:hypothetical protein